MAYRFLAVLGILVSSLLVLAQPAPSPGITFRIKLDPKQVGANPESGRVLVGIAKAGEQPSFTHTDPPVLPILGADADRFGPETVITLDTSSATFPIMDWKDFPAGEYSVQAIFAVNRDINLPAAPGNRYCEPVKVKLVPRAGSTVALTLDRAFPDEPPADTKTTRYLKIQSRLLSKFHGRPMFYRVGVVLPPNFAREPERRYGLIVHIGGFGTRYTSAASIPPDPRFVQIVPDGAGPFGDPYQVDSANNGPYGAALTQEVIPEIEKSFRCHGTPQSRFTTGASTGGWVSLALQVFYPNYFNGCWSQCPDPVAFERFELIDIYRDRNAYVNSFGFDRPSKRTLDGDVVFTLRHECQIENVLGRSGRWELSGRDWSSWNATYGPRGEDGLPLPLWNGKTGEINRAVVDHWKQFDLKLVLEKNWEELGPKLAGGKVNVWVGEADDYFLNAAVHRLKEAVGKFTNPKFDGTIIIEPRRGHEGGGWTQKEIFDAMAARAGLK
jgi:hypothetical protein